MRTEGEAQGWMLRLVGETLRRNHIFMSQSVSPKWLVTNKRSIKERDERMMLEREKCWSAVSEAARGVQRVSEGVGICW